MTISGYETIVKATKNVIIHRQIQNRFNQCCNHQQGCKDEELLKSLMDSLLRKTQRSCANEKYIVRALQFQLKSKTMKHPFDIINSWWAFVIFEALDGVLNQRHKHDHFQHAVFRTVFFSRFRKLQAITHEINCSV